MDSFAEFQFRDCVWIHVPFRKGPKLWPAMVINNPTPQTVRVICFGTREHIDLPEWQVVHHCFEIYLSCKKRTMSIALRNAIADFEKMSRQRLPLKLPRHNTRTQLIASKMQLKYKNLMKRISASKSAPPKKRVRFCFNARSSAKTAAPVSEIRSILKRRTDPENRNAPSCSFALEDKNTPSCSTSGAIKQPIPVSESKQSIQPPPCRTHGH